MVLSTHLGCLVPAFERCSRPPTPVFIAGPRVIFENMPGPPLITPPEQLEYGGAPVWARLGAANCTRCGRTSVNSERRSQESEQKRSGVHPPSGQQYGTFTTTTMMEDLLTSVCRGRVLRPAGLAPSACVRANDCGTESGCCSTWNKRRTTTFCAPRSSSVTVCDRAAWTSDRRSRPDRAVSLYELFSRGVQPLLPTQTCSAARRIQVLRARNSIVRDVERRAGRPKQARRVDTPNVQTMHQCQARSAHRSSSSRSHEETIPISHIVPYLSSERSSRAGRGIRKDPEDDSADSLHTHCS